MAEIRTKAEFLEKAANGLMGNQMPSWPSVGAALADGHTGEVMIRYREPDSPWMRPNIPVRHAVAHIDAMVERGADRSKFYLTWMSPFVGRLLNAEVWRSPLGLYVHYSRSQTHLREALDKDGHHARGLKAMMVLRSTCDANSMTDIEALLDLYPDACLEITVFDRQIGTIPGRNTVIWEVRNY